MGQRSYTAEYRANVAEVAQYCRALGATPQGYAKYVKNLDNARDGKLYVSAIFDCFDNACLGLSMADNMQTKLVVDTFQQAAGEYDLRGALSHSDRGSQYTSDLFRQTLREYGITQSINRAAGRCHDNAKCESMWARAKQEIMACYNTKMMSCDELRYLIFRYFIIYWNNRRICSAIGDVPPAVKRGAYYEMLYDGAAWPYSL